MLPASPELTLGCCKPFYVCFWVCPILPPRVTQQPCKQAWEPASFCLEPKFKNQYSTLWQHPHIKQRNSARVFWRACPGTAFLCVSFILLTYKLLHGFQKSAWEISPCTQNTFHISAASDRSVWSTDEKVNYYQWMTTAWLKEKEKVVFKHVIANPSFPLTNIKKSLLL